MANAHAPAIPVGSLGQSVLTLHEWVQNVGESLTADEFVAASQTVDDGHVSEVAAHGAYRGTLPP
jgi:hypothetical protein